MSSWKRTLPALAVCVLLSACGAKTNAEFTEAAPDFDGVSLELSGDDGAQSDGTLSSPLTAEASTSQALDADAPELLPAVRKTVRGINQTVAHFVRRIETLIATDPTLATATTHTWTKVEGTLEFRLTINKADAAKKLYTFELEARPAGGSAEFTNVLDGEMAKGQVAHRGAGFLRCDLTALHALENERFPELGELKVKFAHAGAVKKLWVYLKDFQKSESDEKATAAYVYTRLGKGLAGAIKLAIHADLYQPQGSDSTKQEFLLIRGRWLRDFKARFDAVAFGGDIPEHTWTRGRECVDLQDRAVFKLVTYHVPGAAPVVLRKVGEVSACHPLLRADPAASDLPEDEAQADAQANSDAEVTPPAE